MDRRHFLKHVAGATALAVPSLQFMNGLKAAETQLKKENKSLIILWMGGGPSHMDLWDLKPKSQNGGEFKEIETAAKGVKISEVLPNTAKVFDKLIAVRSLVTNEGSHERGTTLMNTGRQPSPVVEYPHMGAVASSLITPKELPLPGFIGIGGTAQRIGPGFLGMMYSPFTVQNPGQPPANIKPPQGLGSNEEEQMERLHRRQRLFYGVEEQFGREMSAHAGDPRKHEEGNTPAQAHQAVYKKAFDLTVSPLRTVFEVRNEPEKRKALYGGDRNQFGMGCLLAAKLVEKGVTAIEVDLGGWDNHANIFNTIKTGNGPRLDQGIAGLVQDLTASGLWKNTAIVWMGEFGRTPRINNGGGRDHWGRCWSVVMGGGALKGGQAYGATDADGTSVADNGNPCKIGDVYATLFKALGVDPATQIRDNLGRPMPIADGKPIPGLV